MIKDVMVQLGWSHYEDDYWTKGQLGKMKFEDAVVWELRYLQAFERSCYSCPDCGYKVSANEFVQNG